MENNIEKNTGENSEDSNENISKKVERQELEKKYYSQKKEIRKKINDTEKALMENVKLVEEDYEKVLKEEPNLLSEDDKKGYKEYIATEKEKVRIEIENLQAHENELELDYEDLKTEPKVDMIIDYSKTVNHVVGINAPIMKIVFDYFNYLNDNRENQKKSKIKIDCFTNEAGLFMDSFPQNTHMEYYSGNVVIDFKDVVRIIITMKKYYEQGKGFVHKMCFVSEGKTYLNPDYLGKKILFNAISHSKIKGSYLTMEPDSITWKQEKLERRAFSDIYLPKSIMQDLGLYTTLYDKTGKLLRYLMIGNPGTGKTESTLAIANYLKDKQVTIIKTVVCGALKEKIELAELLAPCLVIFDDIDLSLGSRKRGGVSSGLAQFLDVLDGTEKIRKDVGIIATTNSLELLDMAAQRPGRFDKLLSFDSLTKSNIRNIILKSLKYNFEIDESSNQVAAFTDSIVVDKFHSSRVTGAHVYNSIKMLFLRIDTLEIEDISAEWVVSEIDSELKTLNRIRKTDYLNPNLAPANNEIGFPMSMRNESDEDELAMEEEFVASKKISDNEMSFNSREQSSGTDYKYRPENDSSKNHQISKSNEASGESFVTEQQL